jgi:hypothetical protein
MTAQFAANLRLCLSVSKLRKCALDRGAIGVLGLLGKQTYSGFQLDEVHKRPVNSDALAQPCTRLTWNLLYLTEVRKVAKGIGLL